MAKKKKSNKSATANKAALTAPLKAPAPAKAPLRASTKTPMKAVAAAVKPAARGEDKGGAAPRGTVSTKPVGRVRNFLHEVRVEMKKVTWPPRKELIKSTGVVIVAVVIAAVFIGAFDLLWDWLVEVTRLVPPPVAGG